MQLKTVMPENSCDVLIYDKTGKMTKYQISKLKKSFMDFIQGECTQLKVNNFFALELVKQAIQPLSHGRLNVKTEMICMMKSDLF